MPTASFMPTAEEQLMLELVNRMRLDPGGELAAWGVLPADVSQAMQYFGSLPGALAAQMQEFAAVAPLAWNAALARAAAGHNAAMIAQDQQSHRVQGPDGAYLEPGLADRAQAAGYGRYLGLSENVYAYAADPFHAHAGFVVDWGYDSEDFDAAGRLHPDWRSRGDGMQDPAGHRNTLMNGARTEIGIAIAAETDPATGVGPFLVTQDLGARRDYLPQLLGVVFDDADADRFYGIGEGLSGARVVASGAAGVFATATWAAGGYQMELPAGTYAVAFLTGGAGAAVTATVTIGAGNVKQDARVQDALVSEQEIAGTAGADRLTGGFGSDRLHGDGVQPLHDPEVHATVYRAYLATLDRVPDVAGYLAWGAWLRADPGRDIHAAFVGSAEFRAKYGGLDDAGFVTQLYRNVLHREPDAAGLQGWTAALEDGGRTREALVADFAGSAEFRAMTDAAAARFALARDAAGWNDEVYRLYLATLDRVPEATGLHGWSARLAGGMDYADAVAGFVDSPEFAAAYGALADADFVALLYRNVLDRAPDQAGLQGWLAQLASGQASRQAVVTGFSDSREFIAATAPGLKAWMRAAEGGDVLDPGLSGPGGTDLLHGGAGADEFVFRAIAGADTVLARAVIADPEPWDLLRFQGFGYATAADVRARIVRHDDGALFHDQGVEVLIRGMSPADLADDMFLF